MTLTVETASGFTIGSSPIILDRSSPDFQDWCFDSYHCCTAYHSEFSVCVILLLYVFNIFFCHCSVCLSVCLVLWASLPEIKIDGDDDD